MYLIKEFLPHRYTIGDSLGIKELKFIEHFKFDWNVFKARIGRL